MRTTDVWLVPQSRVHHMADLEEARAVFSGIYSESRLEPSLGRAFSCELRVITCGAVRIVHETWPTGGRCTIPRVLGRYLITGALHGKARGIHANEPYELEPARRSAVLSPERPVTLECPPAYQGRSVAIERATLESHFTALTSRELPGPLVFDVALDLTSAAGVGPILKLFVEVLELPTISSFLVASLRDALLTALLTGTRHSASSLLEAPPRRAAPASVRRAEEFIEAHAGEPISLADIVAATGVPERSLRGAFMAARGMSPGAFLRRRRFELARQTLLAGAPGTTVAGVVASLGFVSGGRFSVEYKKLFEESPSDTLAASRGPATKRPPEQR
ncbi:MULTISPECIES: AraC family transcriptional regulator [Corallococcus]|uniref:AraC family transcriptional regulator n=1 Tax=Corallococcus TaxID=83461 RepID=UPI001315872C|nr:MULTISPECIES: AraC family transcriptional regulator [Corallococcus]NPC70776.1 AraC family transcriptional regulator [Corallococcus exiguus]NPD22105.1 AraC family transcriptional regulator [Corallococcus exiguus]NRD48343.1 AraC family transcriptional regulator [Corallococcus exiguus]